MAMLWHSSRFSVLLLLFVDIFLLLTTVCQNMRRKSFDSYVIQTYLNVFLLALSVLKVAINTISITTLLYVSLKLLARLANVMMEMMQMLMAVMPLLFRSHFVTVAFGTDEILSLKAIVIGHNGNIGANANL